MDSVHVNFFRRDGNSVLYYTTAFVYGNGPVVSLSPKIFKVSWDAKKGLDNLPSKNVVIGSREHYTNGDVPLDSDEVDELADKFREVGCEVSVASS